ncbi:MAG: phosphate ABC transporter permease subunit PstC [Alphaproteobacteria bacterium]|nr:phosphate ABC transporter permease subunit PstC [Alphaproteobacteria bacterium]
MGAMSVSGPMDAAEAAKNTFPDRLFHAITWFFAMLVLVLLAGVAATLVQGSWPALAEYGLKFFISSAWNPVTDRYGALVPVYGTLATAAIAMLIGVPLSFGVAFFLTELCPNRLKRPIGLAIELLAAIPSIIYGMWGLFVLAPFLQRTVQPFLIHSFGGVPVLGEMFAGPPVGIGILTAGVILGVMILPYVAAVMRDVFETIPPSLRESAYGLGATQWEVVWYVVLPRSSVGVVGGIMLGLGRALGETMAVTFVIGNAHHISGSLLAPGTTIASALANEFTEAVGDLYTSALMALGLVLFAITFTVLAGAKRMLIRLHQSQGS